MACPAHAPEADALEKAHHDWHTREVDARNAWVKANPPPKLPHWLHNAITGMH